MFFILARLFDGYYSQPSVSIAQVKVFCTP